MSYKKLNRLLDMPKVRVQSLTALASDARVYSAVHSRKEFRGIIATVKLPHGTDADEDNLPTKFEIYGVEDSSDVAATRVMVVEKDLDGVTDWSGYMQI
ncbi:MAG: hypothetical protein JNK57_22750, partial [Planctomycetaceae bacterium]|nr:hypothetical protein [Planctomycetaceae bacterium]